MTKPIKKLRETLFNIHPLSYRIRKITLDRPTMEKVLFKKIIDKLKSIEERRDFMQAEIGMDVTAYEDSFFDVIENLMKLYFNMITQTNTTWPRVCVHRWFEGQLRADQVTAASESVVLAPARACPRGHCVR